MFIQLTLQLLHPKIPKTNQIIIARRDNIRVPQFVVFVGLYYIQLNLGSIIISIGTAMNNKITEVNALKGMARHSLIELKKELETEERSRNQTIKEMRALNQALEKEIRDSDTRFDEVISAKYCLIYNGRRNEMEF